MLLRRHLVSGIGAIALVAIVSLTAVAQTELPLTSQNAVYSSDSSSLYPPGTNALGSSNLVPVIRTECRTPACVREQARLAAAAKCDETSNCTGSDCASSCHGSSCNAAACSQSCEDSACCSEGETGCCSQQSCDATCDRSGCCATVTGHRWGLFKSVSVSDSSDCNAECTPNGFGIQLAFGWDSGDDAEGEPLEWNFNFPPEGCSSACDPGCQAACCDEPACCAGSSCCADSGCCASATAAACCEGSSCCPDAACCADATCIAAAAASCAGSNCCENSSSCAGAGCCAGADSTCCDAACADSTCPDSAVCPGSSASPNYATATISWERNSGCCPATCCPACVPAEACENGCPLPQIVLGAGCCDAQGVPLASTNGCNSQCCESVHCQTECCPSACDSACCNSGNAGFAQGDYASQMASLVQSALKGRDMNDPAAMEVVHKAMLMVQERAQLEAATERVKFEVATEMALMMQEHQRQMLEMSARLMRAEMELNTSVNVNHVLGEINNNLSRLNFVQNEMYGSIQQNAARQNVSATAQSSPLPMSRSQLSSVHNPYLMPQPVENNTQHGVRVPNVFHLESRLEQLEQQVDSDYARRTQMPNSGTNLNVRPAQHLQPIHPTGRLTPIDHSVGR